MDVVAWQHAPHLAPRLSFDMLNSRCLLPWTVGPAASSSSNSNPHNLPITQVAIMLVSLTVGKVDAGMAVLLAEDKRIVHQPIHPFPSFYR